MQNSVVITYHNYEEPQWHLRPIELLKSANRPVIGTEYMASFRNSRFSNILPLFKEKNVGAINWGFVAGKSNTIYAWDMPIPTGEQPVEWFHDIFFPDGTPYRQDEVNLAKCKCLLFSSACDLIAHYDSYNLSNETVGARYQYRLIFNFEF